MNNVDYSSFWTSNGIYTGIICLSVRSMRRKKKVCSADSACVQSVFFTSNNDNDNFEFVRLSL
jgi:hypothetical protein